MKVEADVAKVSVGVIIIVGATGARVKAGVGITIATLYVS